MLYSCTHMATVGVIGLNKTDFKYYSRCVVGTAVWWWWKEELTCEELSTCLSLDSVSMNSCRNSSSYWSTCTPAAHQATASRCSSSGRETVLQIAAVTHWWRSSTLTFIPSPFENTGITGWRRGHNCSLSWIKAVSHIKPSHHLQSKHLCKDSSAW